MCMFSRSVESVSDTKIFARMTGRREVLVYSMKLAAREELAMVLPLPTAWWAGVRFINLEDYPDLFDDLNRCFPPPPRPAAGGALPGSMPAFGALRVHDVGAFEASFVPTIADFVRLDPRFSLPPQVWNGLSAYRDWGFAVFKLKAPGEGGATRQFHPMAFEFRSRERNRLFFPTVHVHDGQVHPRASFSHTLYCQMPSEASRGNAGWQPSPKLAGECVDAAKAKKTVSAEDVVYRCSLFGNHPNTDQWVSLAGA